MRDIIRLVAIVIGSLTLAGGTCEPGLQYYGTIEVRETLPGEGSYPVYLMITDDNEYPARDYRRPQPEDRPDRCQYFHPKRAWDESSNERLSVAADEPKVEYSAWGAIGSFPTWARLGAFVDLDDNGWLDPGEPFGEYADNPIDIRADDRWGDKRQVDLVVDRRWPEDAECGFHHW